MAEEDERPKVSPRARLYNLTSLAFVFPVAIGGSTFAGHYLDQRLGTFPWLTILFFFLGIAAGFVSLFRAIRAFDESK